MGRVARRGLSLPIRCPNVALDERLEPLALLLAAAHRVGVDPQREGRVGVPELLHDVGRILADRDQGAGPLGPRMRLKRVRRGYRAIVRGV